VDRVVAADILHIKQRPVLLAKNAAMDRAGGEIKARAGVDLFGQRIEPRGLQHRVPRQRDLVELLHQVAEHRALRAARGERLLAQLLLERGLALGAHHHGFELVIVVDGSDLVVGAQHVLVEEIAHGEAVGMIADRHHGDDLLPVEKERQRALDHHGGYDRIAVLIDARHPARQSRIVGVGPDDEFLHEEMMGRAARACKGLHTQRASDGAVCKRLPACALRMKMDAKKNRPREESSMADGAISKLGSRALAFAAALALFVAAPACAADHLRVGKPTPEAYDFALVQVGIDAGIFAKHDLDIETISLAGSAKLHQALIAGSIDIAMGAGTDLVFIAKGAPEKAIAAMAGPPNNMAVIVAAHGPVQSVADLKGRKIGVSTVGS